jgi:hypothetical protein
MKTTETMEMFDSVQLLESVGHPLCSSWGCINANTF